MNVQMGLSRDLDPCSFVDAELHGGEKAVQELQDVLLKNALQFRGTKVILEKVQVASTNGKRNVRYDICLQTDKGRGLLIGRTGDQVTKDLLDLLWNRGLELPKTMFNLRVGEVISCSVDEDLPETVPEPFRSARLWLGVSLMGTGDFTKRNRQ